LTDDNISKLVPSPCPRLVSYFLQALSSASSDLPREAVRAAVKVMERKDTTQLQAYTHTHIRPRSNDKSVIPMNIANRESAIIIYEHLQNNMGKTCDMLVSMCEG